MKKIFSLTKNLLPKISETEMIALKSGTVSVDRMIFEGKIKYEKLPKYKSISTYPHKESILNNIKTEPLYQ